MRSLLAGLTALFRLFSGPSRLKESSNCRLSALAFVGTYSLKARES